MSDLSGAGSPPVCPWRAGPERPDLPCGEIHLWWVPLAAPARVTDSLVPLLSRRELARAERFRFDHHRISFILGRGTLRRLLSGYTGIPPAALEFRLGPHGKPSLASGAGDDGLRFNYSDAGGYALYGFLREGEIGVDLESLDREVRYEAIARRKFSRAECEAILARPAKERKAAFLACWTRKEGYGKAEGWGINYPLDSVEVCADCDAGKVSLQTPGGRTRRWTLLQIHPTPRFVGCVVYPTPADPGRDPAFRFFSRRPG